jgi:hypothetical protein
MIPKPNVLEQFDGKAKCVLAQYKAPLLNIIVTEYKKAIGRLVVPPMLGSYMPLIAM